MTDGLSDRQLNIINILAWVLLTIMIGYSAWLGIKYVGLREMLPKEYVRLERYTCDIQDLKEFNRAQYINLKEQLAEANKKLDKLDDKISQHSERQPKKNRGIF